MTRSSAPRSVPVQVTEYLAAKAERKRGALTTLHAMMLRLMPGALTTLHAMMLRLMPGARVWFLDGKDEDGRTLSDPSIGHGLLNKAYADGRAREFYQIGLSANTAAWLVG